MQTSEYKVSFSREDIESLPFTNQVLKPIETTDYEFIGSEIGSVDLSEVVGVCHPDYQGKSWGELVPGENEPYPSLKRAKRAMRDLAASPDYYLSHDEKYDWDFAFINGECFVSGGVHRTIVGRAFLSVNKLPTVVHGVSIAQYREPAERSDAVHVNDSLSESQNPVFSRFNWGLLALILLLLFMW